VVEETPSLEYIEMTTSPSMDASCAPQTKRMAFKLSEMKILQAYHTAHFRQ